MNSKPGRLLMLTSTFPRWENDNIPHFVYHLALDLQAIGWEVHILAPHAPGAAFEETMQGLRVFRFAYFLPLRQQSLCYQRGALVNLRDNPLNAIKIPFLLLTEYLAVKKLLRTYQYELIHSHWLLPQGFIAALLSRRKQLVHVNTVHGSDVFSLNAVIFKCIKKFAVHRCDAITVNSSATEAAVSELLTGDTPVKRISMGISIPELDKKHQQIRKLRLTYQAAESPLLIFAGRLIKEKGVGDIIHALQIIRKSHPNVKLIIAGQGNDTQEFQQLTATLGLTSQVYFTGWIAPEKMPLLLAAADVFIGATRLNEGGCFPKEAQGLVFVEAMSTKTAVVASRVGGIPDFVIDGETGLLVDERSPQQIALAVQKLLDNPDLYKRLVTKAYQRVLRKFTRTKSAQSFNELFLNILLQKQSG